MRFTNPFIFVVLTLVITSTAAPLSPPTNVMRSGANVRGVGQTIADIISNIAEGIIEGLLTDLINFDKNMHEAEIQFTQQMSSSLSKQFPRKNYVIFHNQKSAYRLSPDVVHQHFEVDIGLGSTQGYEVLVFDSGTFTLSGDAGWENWAFGGCSFSRGGNTVNFNKCP